MHQPLGRREKLVWIASWVAPLALWGVFIVLGLVVAWPSLRGEASLHAWLIGLVVVVALVAHSLVWHHGATAEHFTAEERTALKGRLRRAGGHGHWRALMKKYQRTWYKGRSHSGGRPRFD
jgi:hypothetical protein